MAKRFTDTEIWKDNWFRNLSTKNKELWRFLYENCDIAGCWKIDMEFLRFSMPGEAFDDNPIDSLCIPFNKGKDRVCVFDDNSRVFLIDFVEFQYGYLSGKSRVHESVAKKLEELIHRGLEIAYLKGIDTLKDKYKDKDKDKEKEKDNSFGKSENLFLARKDCGVCEGSGKLVRGPKRGETCWCVKSIQPKKVAVPRKDHDVCNGTGYLPDRPEAKCWCWA